MTKKQRKQLAQRIAKLEHIIQTSTDKDEVRTAKDNMVQLQASADMDLEDMCVVDEMVQEILSTLTS